MKIKRSLNYLRKLAQATTSFRGHRMKWGSPFGKAGGPFSQFGRCKKCGKETLLTESPAPNEIDISGEAVALNCDRELPSVSVSYTSVNQDPQGSMTTLPNLIANSRATNEETT